jgi:hypothetical protein
MTEVIHPILGAVDPFEPGFWEADVAFGGRICHFDLTIEGSDVPDVPASALQKR